MQTMRALFLEELRAYLRTNWRNWLQMARSSGSSQLHSVRDDRNRWYRRRDSNPHCLVPKTSASSQLGYAGLKRRGDTVTGRRGATSPRPRVPLSPRLFVVDLARFERAASTFAESRSNSTELQIQGYF